MEGTVGTLVPSWRSHCHIVLGKQHQNLVSPRVVEPYRSPPCQFSTGSHQSVLSTQMGGVASRYPHSTGLPLPLPFTSDLSFCVWNSSSKYSHRRTQPYIYSPVSRLRWFLKLGSGVLLYCKGYSSSALSLGEFPRWSCNICNFSLIFFGGWPHLVMLKGKSLLHSRIIPGGTLWAAGD